MMNVIGIDLECDDPLLLELGPSWAYGKGEILCTAVYYKAEKRKTVLHGNGGEPVKALLLDPNVILVGANIIYDLGWLCYEFHIAARDIKATIIDVLIAESHIDEYAQITLDNVAMKYVHKGKSKARVEEWIKNLVIDGVKIYSKGDFRKYLKYARDLRWDLLEEYAQDDASLPCEVWDEQCKVLEKSQDRFYCDYFTKVKYSTGTDENGNEQYRINYIPHCNDVDFKFTFKGVTYDHVSCYDRLAKKRLEQLGHIDTLTPYEKQELLFKGTIYPVFIDFALIPIVLQAKQRGILMDWELKQKNALIFQDIYKELRSDFVTSYGEVNTGSTKQKAALFDTLKIPYQDRITVKSVNGVPLTSRNYREVARILRKNLLRGIHAEKGKVVMYEDHKYAPRAVEILNANGCLCTCNPKIDKIALKELKDQYPVCGQIINMNKAKSILDKILGEKYDRFKGPDGRVHPDLNISKGEDRGTKTGRLSCCNPNAQQIPAHGDLVLGASKTDVSKLCRSIFIASHGSWAHMDYPQIEFRLFAHFACGKGAAELRKKLRDNPHMDFHSIVAAITGLPRDMAKHITFGTLYGMGVAKLMLELGCSQEEAEKVFARYFDNVPCVRSTMKEVSLSFIEKGYVVTIAGRHFHLQSEDTAYRGINGLDQGSSADMTKKAIVVANDRGLWDKLEFYMTVHDELDFEVLPTRESVEAAVEVTQIMANAYVLNVPVFVEPEIGANWFEASDKKAAGRFVHLNMLTSEYKPVRKCRYSFVRTEDICRRKA